MEGQEQSLCSGSGTTDNRDSASASSSRLTPPQQRSDGSDFSEPDPDFSQEWLQPISAENSRASSPHEFTQTPLQQCSDFLNFGEHDSDSSHELLRSISSGSSRASSPERDDASSRAHPSKSATKAKKRGRKSNMFFGQDTDTGNWRQGDWQPNQIPFTATPGPQSAAAELDSHQPADFLELFLTDDLLQHIVQQTNLHASQFFEAHPENPRHSRGKAWKPVTVPELKTFFGLTFLTSYVKKPNIDLYWSVDEVDATPYFSQTMSRNRFQIIWRFLHYSNNATQDYTDKMYKVRPVLDYIVEKFKEMFCPG